MAIMIILKLISRIVLVVIFISLLSLDVGMAQSAEDYVAKGRAKFEKGDYKGAILDFNKAIALDPNNAISYAGRGFPKGILKDYPGAILDFNKAIKLDPNNDIYYTFRGNAKAALDDPKGALEDYNKAISLNPNGSYRILI